jgi:anti-sigma factor RsiW
MTDCPNAETRDRLPDLVNGSLDGGARAIVERHVAGCSDCAAEVELLRRVRRVLAPTAPAFDVATIVAALPAPRRSAAPWSRLASWKVAAAVSLFAVGIGSYSVMSRAPLDAPAADSISAPAAADLAVAGGLEDLSDDALEDLAKRIEDIEALPSTRVLERVAPTVRPSGEPLDSLINDLSESGR